MKKLIYLGLGVCILLSILFLRRADDLGIEMEPESPALVLQLPPGSTCLLVSNIRGEVASFNRILASWKQRSLIDQSFIIFNGNIIGNAPGQQELLKSITDLMKERPGHVFYIKGPIEDREGWLNTPLSSYRTIIRTFFNGRPLGIYLLGQDDKIPLRISYFGADSTAFSSLACQAVHKGYVQAQCTLDDLCSFSQGPVAGYIVGDETGIDWQTMLGLQYTEPATWHIVSSPTREFKEKYRFFNDAYAVFTMGKTLATSTITYYHTTKDQDTFVQGATYQLIK